MEFNQELTDLLIKCHNNYAVAGKTFFPNRFRRPFDPVHYQIFNHIKQGLKKGKQKISIMAPRGIGKTSINNYLLPAHRALFGLSKYIVPISATTDGARLQSENLKNGLKKSKFVKEVFGNIFTKKQSIERWVLEVGEGQDAHQCCIMPRGAGQQIRGLLWGDYRPDCFIIDDLEDPRKMPSAVQRKKTKEWFHSDVEYAVEPGSKDWVMIMLGTLLHEDALIKDTHDDPDWYSLRLEICDDDYNTKAPNIYSTEELKVMADKARKDGNINVFFREMRNLSKSSEDAAFDSENFRYYTEETANLNLKAHIENIVIYDPAKSVESRSADSAIVGVGYDRSNSKIYVRDVVCDRLYPDEAYEQVASMTMRLNADLIAYEVTGLNEFIKQPFLDYLSRQNITTETLELNARKGIQEQGKLERIKSLVPYYRQNLVYHNPNLVKKLEFQLEMFPVGKKVDAADALAYVVQILNLGERYMMPTKEEMRLSRDKVEAEYEALEGMRTLNNRTLV